jgi:hypothetical protein
MTEEQFIHNLKLHQGALHTSHVVLHDLGSDLGLKRV